jgi:hypothetical protein
VGTWPTPLFRLATACYRETFHNSKEAPVSRDHFRAFVRRLVTQTQRRLDLKRFRNEVTNETFIVIYVNSRDTEDTVRNLRRFADVRATPRQVRGLARYVRMGGLPLRHLV